MGLLRLFSVVSILIINPLVLIIPFSFFFCGVAAFDLPDFSNSIFPGVSLLRALAISRSQTLHLHN